MENMFLKGNQNEKFEIKGNEVIVSSWGRIYINSVKINEYYQLGNTFTYQCNNQVKRIDFNSIFNNYLINNNEIKYNYFGVDDKSIFVLNRYLNISNDFMKHLILLKYTGDFEYFLDKYIAKYKNISKEDGMRLLKPVFVRYEWLRKTGNQERVLANINNYTIPSKIVLYDVSAILDRGKLKLLDNLILDMREQIGMSIYTPITLGNVMSFSKVIINLTLESNLIDYRISNIELIGNVREYMEKTLMYRKARKGAAEQYGVNIPKKFIEEMKITSEERKVELNYDEEKKVIEIRKR